MMAMVADESPVDSGQFTIGVIDFLGAAGNGKEYDFDKNYNYTIKKGEWTKIERTFTHTGEHVYGVSLDQTSVPGVEHEIISVKDMYVDNVCVKVSDEVPPLQPILTTEELVNIANLGVQVFIDGKRLIFGSDKAPEIINGRTLVPLRKIFEKLGTAVYWDGATSTVTGKRGDKEIKLTIWDTTAYVDGSPITLDVPAQIIEGRTMVPIRFIADSLGCQVGWTEKAKRVDITSSENINEINVYTDSKHQEIYGFGASANHNAGFIMNSSKEMQKKTMKALFDLEEGIGLNIMRLEVNPFAKGKDKSNMVDEFQFTINPAKDVWEMDADTHQIWYANEAEKYNPDMVYLASPWSPPSWMKVNDSVIGKTELPNELAKEHYEDYATYLAKWTKYYTENLGFDIKWVSVQNEPDGSTQYASCEYSDLQMVEIARLIMKKFKEEGITALVGLPESSTLISTNTYLKQIEKNSPDFLDEMQVILAHSYSYSDTNLDSTNMERFNIPLLQTEKNDGPSVKRVNNNEKLLRYSNEITDHLNHNYGAWLYWYGIRKVSNLGSQNSESLIDFNDETKEIAFADEYYSLGHYSKFIKPGSTRVASYSQNKNINVVSALDETTGKLVVVITNNGDTDETIKVKGLSDASVAELCRSSENEKLANIGTCPITNGEAQIVVKAKSITTFVEK